MATGAIAGYKGALFHSTASPSTAGGMARLAEVEDWSLSVEHAEIDATSHDSSGTREIIAGIDQWSGSADYLQVTANATHKNVYDLLVAKTKLDFEFYPTGSSSDGYFSGSGFFTGWDLNSPNEDALAASVSFAGTDALTRTSSA